MARKNARVLLVVLAASLWSCNPQLTDLDLDLDDDCWGRTLIDAIGHLARSCQAPDAKYAPYAFDSGRVRVTE